MAKVDLSFFDKSPEWLEGNTIFLSLHGSHAYGMNTPESDLDIRGVAVPPQEMLLGCFGNFEQHSFSEPDCTIFALQKFMKLCTAGNPNALEILFTEPEDHILVTKHGQILLDNRNLFLSQKMRHTFSGYAHAQLKRINTHRKWLLNPPKAPPTRQEMGLPERTVIAKDQYDQVNALIKKQIESWDIDLTHLDEASTISFQNHVASVLSDMGMASDAQFRAAGRVIGLDENFLEILDKERAYKAKKTEFDQYQNWKANRNPKRAAMEEETGFDRKHGSHLIRLYRSCIDVITTGTLKVKRPDAAELLAIKNGAWSYERLIFEAEKMEAQIVEAMKTTKLPHDPNRSAINKLCIEITRSFI